MATRSMGTRRLNGEGACRRHLRTAGHRKDASGSRAGAGSWCRGRRGSIRELRRRWRSRCSSARRGRHGDDARPARPRRPRCGEPRASRRRRSCRPRACEHVGTRARDVAHGVSRHPHRELRPLDTAAIAELAESIAGDAAVSLPARCRAGRDRRHSAARSTRSLRSGCEPRRAAGWNRRRCVPPSAVRSCAPHRPTSRTASSTSSELWAGSEGDAGAPGNVCPYKGLASFDVADADTFFGREQLVAELVARMPGATLLGVVGPSGSGKSSIVRAGLSAALARGALPGSEEWVQVVIRPGEHPLDELGQARRRREGREALARHRSARGGLHALQRRGRACAVPRRASRVPLRTRPSSSPSGPTSTAALRPSARSRASSPRITFLSAR